MASHPPAEGSSAAAPSAARPADLKRLGRYRIVRPLSKGGMALVYEARRESLAGVSPRVAIKLILPEHENSETFRQLFINEARLGASMHHQNLVQIQDFDCDGDRYFLVMEYVEGPTLRRVISLCQRHSLQIPMAVIAELGRQACDGLHYAHLAKDDQDRHLGLVHRDIKPSNLILGPHGGVKVLDFGISKGRLRQERHGSVKGTWGYMAPEQAQGESVRPTADVFGLAVVLYELAALRPMFQGKKRDEIKRLLKDDHAARMAATLEGEYAPLIPILVRALQRDPRGRYGSAEELGRALSAVLPDPVTVRDEVTRFYRTVDALEAGRVVPGKGSTSQGSLVASPSQEPEASGGMGWMGMVAAACVAAMVLAGAGALMAFSPEGIAVRTVEPTEAQVQAEPEDPRRFLDEPSGPAGEGAPGELQRRTRERRPPVAATSVRAEVEDPTEELSDEPETVRVRVVRERPAPAEIGEDAAEVVEEGGEPEAASATLFVGARQRAEVYIGGQYVDDAPVREVLPPGNYAVTVVALDGRRKTFDVDLREGQRLRRVWDFDRLEWR